MYRTALTLAASVLALHGCATSTEKRPANVTLPPMERPADPQIGDLYISIEDAEKEVRVEVIGIDSEAVAYETNDGCVFALPKSGFAPVSKFAGCEGSSGVQDVTLTNGSPWPLSVGTSWQYRFSGTNTDGDTWQGVRTCRVEGAVRVTAPIGTYDTFEVVCDEPNRTRTYYASPELGAAVVFMRHDKRRNTTLERKLIRIERQRGS